MSSSQPTFDWLTLGADEQVVWAGNPHESSLVPALVVGVPLSLLLIGIPIVVSAYLRREATEYVVTTEALYRKSGILSRNVQRVDFAKVQNTSYSQGLFGRQFGYGNIDVSTAGGAGVELTFRSVPEPKDVQELINARVKGSERETPEDASAVLDQILTELRAIRSAVEAGQLADRNADGVVSEEDSVDGEDDTVGRAEDAVDRDEDAAIRDGNGGTEP